MNVRVDLNAPIKDGQAVVFRAPCGAAEVTGLTVYYPVDGVVESQTFAFADAHANDLADLEVLFAKDAVVKVILDLSTNMAFVQNADTNVYLEGRIDGVDLKLPQDMTPEQQAQARQNIGAITDNEMVTSLGFKDVTGYCAGFRIECYDSVPNEDDPDLRHPVASFNETSNDISVVLRNVHDGTADNDAATVGQAKVFYVTVTEAEDGTFTADKTFAEVKAAYDSGRTVCGVFNGAIAHLVIVVDDYIVFGVCVGHDSYNAMLFPDETIEVQVIEMPDSVDYMKVEEAYQLHSAMNERTTALENTIGDIETALENRYTKDEIGELAYNIVLDLPSKAYVYEEALSVANTVADSKTDYVTLAETILTEDVNEIIWTQGDNGEVLSDYKDFFIYWVGMFDTDASGEAWICRANAGGTYFCYGYITKYSSRWSGYWWDIKEIGQLPDGRTLWKSSSPDGLLLNYTDASVGYGTQGLSDARRTTKDCISATTETINKLRFGSLSAGAKMVAGSKAVLLGRKR